MRIKPRGQSNKELEKDTPLCIKEITISPQESLSQAFDHAYADAGFKVTHHGRAVPKSPSLRHGFAPCPNNVNCKVWKETIMSACHVRLKKPIVHTSFFPQDPFICPTRLN